MKHAYWYLRAALAAGTATAQPGTCPDPADADAPVPAPTQRSAFEGYRRLERAERIARREANEEVRRVGGHLGILHELAARRDVSFSARKPASHRH